MTRVRETKTYVDPHGLVHDDVDAELPDRLLDRLNKFDLVSVCAGHGTMEYEPHFSITMREENAYKVLGFMLEVGSEITASGNLEVRVARYGYGHRRIFLSFRPYDFQAPPEWWEATVTKLEDAAQALLDTRHS